MNATTYLPVRLSWSAGNGSRRTTVRTDLQWLPPTPAHLAKLTIPIPPGFHRIGIGR
ncbi:MAG TPA: hypothetical protein VGH27_15850 [Streptosporangiaceae bacterium]